jgi:chromosome segregation ATPase
MGFDLNRHKKESGDSMWTSYSDLFLGLSIIFLLLYVSASLKQGTDGIKQHMEYKLLKKENEDLQQQIKAYETLKQDYLQRQASADESDNYKELMDRLNLLQDEAKDEKTKLRLQANENEKKEKALNQYQQMIRNIINSNMVAKARIKSRDTMIDTKEDVIVEKNTEITGLENDVAQKKQVIAQTEAKATSLENKLDKRLKQLRSAYKAQNISKKKFEQERAQIQTEYEGKIAKVRDQQRVAKAEYDKASAELAETQNALVKTQGQLDSAKGNIASLNAKTEQLKGALSAADAKFQAEAAAMRGKFASQAAAERAAFEKALAGERLSGEQKAARERAYAAAAAGKARELEGQIGSLGKELGATKGALAKAAQDAADAEGRANRAMGVAQAAENKAAEAMGRIGALRGELEGTKGELARAQENLNAKKRLAEQIMRNFAAKGVKADVDARSGDVMLEFGDQYFDTGRADLKPKMRSVLEKAMPAYSASLFDDPKVASKIQAVEIVGFASPTYKGKFINPKSLDPDDRKAVNYNLDLSYNRARSIFNYVFDKNKMAFKHQKKLLPLVKVTGRSFLSGADDDRGPAAAGTAEEFCRKNDCAKLQRVIIKFQLKD